MSDSEDEEHVAEHPLTLFLVLATLNLVFGLAVTAFSFHGLRSVEFGHKRGEKLDECCLCLSDKKIPRFKLLVYCVFISNAVFQLYIELYYVIQRAFMRGFGKGFWFHVCQLNQFLFWQSAVALAFVLLLMFERLTLAFVNAAESLRVSDISQRMMYFVVALIVLGSELNGMLNAIYTREIHALKSTDGNPYRATNKHLSICRLDENQEFRSVAAGLFISMLGLCAGIIISYLFITRLKAVFENIGSLVSAAHGEHLTRKTLILTLFGVISSIILSLVMAPLTGLYILIALNLNIITLVVSLNFNYADPLYWAVFGWLDDWLAARVDESYPTHRLSAATGSARANGGSGKSKNDSSINVGSRTTDTIMSQTHNLGARKATEANLSDMPEVSVDIVDNQSTLIDFEA